MYIPFVWVWTWFDLCWLIDIALTLVARHTMQRLMSAVWCMCMLRTSSNTLGIVGFLSKGQISFGRVCMCARQRRSCARALLDNTVLSHAGVLCLSLASTPAEAGGTFWGQ